MFRQIFMGEGLEPNDDANKAILIAKGCSEEMVNVAIAAGAQFSRPRQTMIYPIMSPDDFEKEEA